MFHQKQLKIVMLNQLFGKTLRIFIMVDLQRVILITLSFQVQK